MNHAVDCLFRRGGRDPRSGGSRPAIIAGHSPRSLVGLRDEEPVFLRGRQGGCAGFCIVIFCVIIWIM